MMDFNNVGDEDDHHAAACWDSNVLWAVIAVALCVFIGWLAAQGF